MAIFTLLTSVHSVDVALASLSKQGTAGAAFALGHVGCAELVAAVAIHQVRCVLEWNIRRCS